MKKIYEYLKGSDVIITLMLNPSKWSFYFHYVTHSDMDPGLLLDLVIKLGFIKLVIYIDDGRW